MEVTLPIAEDHLKGYLNEFVKAKMNAKDSFESIPPL